MSDDRSMRNLFAAFFLIAAAFVAMNRIVTSAAAVDWWLPLALLVVGAALALVPKFDLFPARAEPEAQAAQAPALPAGSSEAHTYLVSPQPASSRLHLHTMTIRPDPDTVEYVIDLEDDLTRIKGIGAKSAAALRAAGIDTFAKLGRSSEDDIRAALASGKVRLVGSGHIDTWAEQADYAARGDWEGLRRFNGGK